MGLDLLRDAPIGQIVRFVTNKRYLKYPEEEDDFVWQPATSNPEKPVNSSATTEANSIAGLDKEAEQGSSDESEVGAAHQTLTTAPTRPDNQEKALESDLDQRLSQIMSRSNLSRAATQRDVETAFEDALRQETLKSQPTRAIQPQKTADGRTLVDWYTTDDQANPQNWTRAKKTLVVLQIYIYTLAVYIASAIYTPGLPQVIDQFHVSSTVASLGLSMYVAGYGWGPLLFSPLSEIPVIGRNPPYMVSFAIYLILSIVTAVVNNFPVFVVLRFLQGFFGSPALATGGASVGDLFSFIEMPYYLTFWAGFATCGPALGPIIAGYSVPVEGWHWSMWEVVWLAAPTFFSMMFFLPETSAPNILLNRAKRLRNRTGNTNLVSQSEIDQSVLTVKEVVVGNLWRPVQINLLDPAVAFTSLYIGLLYGIFYSFFESFPLVYGPGNPDSGSPTQGYGMSIGSQGLIFLSISIAVGIAIVIYMAYLYFYFNPSLRVHGLGAPERRLVPGLFASIIAPMGLFIFAWTGQNAPRYHWAIPTLGVVVFTIPVFILFQVIFIYMPMTYSVYSASLFAGNDVVRSSVAAGAIHFAHPLLKNLGVGRGVSLLGGLTVMGVIGVWTLWLFGARLRAMSRFTAK